MAKPFKNKHGRITLRASNGRFKQATLKDFGFDVAEGYRVCNNCEHGAKERWHPILVTGICPICKSQDSREREFPMSEEYAELKKQYDDIANKPFLGPDDMRKLRAIEPKLNQAKNKCIRESFGDSE